MCRRINCPSCGKPSFEGCGMHVEQVLGNVPKEDRCTCREKPAVESKEKSILERIFGR